jgi:hypothetical protein
MRFYLTELDERFVDRFDAAQGVVDDVDRHLVSRGRCPSERPLKEFGQVVERDRRIARVSWSRRNIA